MLTKKNFKNCFQVGKLLLSLSQIINKKKTKFRTCTVQAKLIQTSKEKEKRRILEGFIWFYVVVDFTHNMIHIK